MKCSRCGREISEDQAYAHQGKPVCDECLMDIGLSGKQCDPWSSYVDTHARLRRGLTGSEGLSETEAKVYEFIKSRGRATREEVIKGLSLSEADLSVQLAPLMHSELIKEHSEGGRFYLITID